MFNKTMGQREIWNELYAGNLTWKKETINLSNILRGKRVLELGVGNGKTLISILKQRPSNVQAIDFSIKAIEKARKIFKDRKSVTLLKADAKKMPFPDNSFDVVVVYYVLNNSIEKERVRMMKEIYRVLKKNGKCVFEDFSVNDFRNKGKENRTDKNTVVKKNKLICHFFEGKEVRELFSKFSEVKIKTFLFCPIKHKNNLKREIINCVGK